MRHAYVAGNRVYMIIPEKSGKFPNELAKQQTLSNPFDKKHAWNL